MLEPEKQENGNWLNQENRILKALQKDKSNKTDTTELTKCSETEVTEDIRGGSKGGARTRTMRNCGKMATMQA